MTIPACIGCGAMNVWGTCEDGCAEERLDLVDAAEHDAMLAAADTAERRAAALRPAVAAVADGHAAARDAARAALGAAPQATPALGEPAAVVTTWWCPRCSGLEAPQPCIGVCIRRPVEWVPEGAYAAARARAAAAVEAERAMADVLRLAAYVTPRAGRADQSRAALAARARLLVR